MSDADKNLQIGIKVTSDTAGAKQAEKAISDVEKELDNLSPKTRDYIRKLEEQAKKEEQAVAKKGEVRRGLREIGRELPIVGELGRLAMEPLIGGFVLLSTVVASAFEAIKELGNRSTPEFNTLTEAVEKQRQAMEDVELAAHDYDRALARLAKTSATVGQNSKLFMDVAKSKSDAETAQAEASQKRQEAILESAEKLGLITHQQYIQRRLRLDEDYAAKRAAIENKLQLLGLTEKYRERANTQIEADALEKSIEVKRAAARKSAGKSAFAGGQTEKDKKDLEATIEKIKKLQEEHAELELNTRGITAFTTLKPQVILEQQKAINEREDASEQATADKLRRKLEQDKKQGEAAKDNASAAAGDLQADEERLRKDRERVKDLDRELPTETDVARRQIETRNQTTAAGAQTSGISSLKDLPNALGSAHDLANASAQTLTSLNIVLETVLKNQWAQLDQTKSHSQDVSAITAAIQETNRELARLRAETNARLHGVINK